MLSNFPVQITSNTTMCNYKKKTVLCLFFVLLINLSLTNTKTRGPIILKRYVQNCQIDHRLIYILRIRTNFDVSQFQLASDSYHMIWSCMCVEFVVFFFIDSQETCKTHANESLLFTNLSLIHNNSGVFPLFYTCFSMQNEKS